MEWRNFSELRKKNGVALPVEERFVVIMVCVLSATQID
jgi:hypothetical protein